MTLEYLELMEDVKKSQENGVQGASSPRRKLVESYKSNTRRYDDGSIEIAPQEKGEPSQKDVKKVGKSKRYVTNGKNPLTCVELKCPEDVPDKAAFFHRELAKLTKDIQISEPEMPEGEFLLDEENLKVKVLRTQGLRTKGSGPLCAASSAQQDQTPCAKQDQTPSVETPCAKVVAWLTFEAKGLIDIRRELYNLTSKIDKCLVINEALVAPRQ